jgi:hypothetical protein
MQFWSTSLPTGSGAVQRPALLEVFNDLLLASDRGDLSVHLTAAFDSVGFELLLSD